MRDNTRNIAYWMLFGLMLRFIFMPFTMHPDILHIYYHPHFLTSEGVWDIYSHHADFFLEHRYSYYAPLTYIFFGLYLYIVNPFLSGFGAFMEGVRNVTDYGGGHSGHYLIGAHSDRLFRFLFFMKLPYLLFDIGLLWLLMKFTPRLSDREKGSAGQKAAAWWALNPALIYVSYLFGQFDIIPTFIIILAGYLLFRNKNTLAMISLGIGGAFKSFPLFLIFPLSFYIGRNIRGIIKYILIGILPFFAIVAPFYIASSGKVIGAFFSERISGRLGVTGPWGIIRFSLFTLGYISLCLSLLKESVRERLGGLWQIKTSFIALLLLFISFPISFHYFLWLTPFILILGHRYKLMNLYLWAVFSLAVVALAGKGVWIGLFSPLYPEFFMGFPGIDEVIKRFLPYDFIKTTASLVFAVTLAWMGVLVLKKEDA